MYFVIGLPFTGGGFDYYRWWWTKSFYFIPVKVKYTAEKLAQLYIGKIVRLHGFPVPIVSDRGSLFTSHF